MTSHRPGSGPHQALETYLDNLEHLLHQYKVGELSESDLINRHGEVLVLGLQRALNEAFLSRLANLRAFRTPRGADVPTSAG